MPNYQKIEETITNEHKFMENILSTMSHIYIELDVFKDTKLGTVLLNIDETSTKDFMHIKQNLDKYDRRINHRFLEFFPNLNLTENAMSEFRKNPDNSEKIFTDSPITTGLSQIISLFKELDMQNSKTKSVPVVIVYLNIYPLTPTDNIRNQIKYFFSKVSPRIQVMITSKPCNEISLNTLTKCDMLFLDDIIPFFKNDKYSEEIYKDKCFFESTVMSRYYVEPIVAKEFSKNNTLVDHTKLRIVSQAALNMFMEFTYVDINIQLEK